MAKLLKGVTHLSDNDLRFRSADGISVFVDPVAGPEAKTAVDSGAVKPDLILITHPHGDHFQPAVLQAYLAANPRVVIAGPAEVVEAAVAKGLAGMQVVAPGRQYEMAGVTFETVPAYFDDADHHPKASGWVGYVLQLNGARYYVTGDTQPIAEMAATKANVVFPLLYGCGGNTEQAVKMAKISGAFVVVPVHHSDQKKVISAYFERLPAGIAAGFFAGGRLVSRGDMKTPVTPVAATE